MRKLENEIQSLKDSCRRMTIWPPLETGEFSTISSGQVTDEDLTLADGKWSTFVERMVNKLRGGLRTPTKYGLVTGTLPIPGACESRRGRDLRRKGVLYDDLPRPADRVR